MKKKLRALPLTITLGSILLIFCLVLVTLWNFVLIYNYSQLKQYAGPIRHFSGAFQWLILGIGSFFFVVIIAGVILFMVFLAKQIILNQMQKNFIDSVTHELKTPVTSLKLYIETLKKHELSPDKKENFFNIMLKDVERLDDLINHVLTAAQSEYFLKSFKTKEVNLEKVLAECIEIIQNRYNLEKSFINLNLQEKVIQSDPYALHLIFINLLDNAVKYSTKKPQIVVESCKNPGKIDIIVRDQGVGISKNQINKIFRRFYRIPESITGMKKGSGLGLFIVNETVKSLKGKIEVKSKGRDLGSEFRITLPQKG